MALSIDNYSVTPETSIGIYNISFTIGSSANLLIAIINSQSYISAGPTWNGFNMSSIATVDDGLGREASSFYLTNPTTGTQTFSVTIAGPAAPSVSITLISIIGCDTSAPIDQINTNYNGANPATNPSLSLNTSRSSDLLFGVMRKSGISLTENSGQSEIYNANPNNVYDIGDIICYKTSLTGAPGSYSIGFTGSSSDAPYAFIIFAIEAPAPTTTSTTITTSTTSTSTSTTTSTTHSTSTTHTGTTTSTTITTSSTLSTSTSHTTSSSLSTSITTSSTLSTTTSITPLPNISRGKLREFIGKTRGRYNQNG